MFKTWGGYDVDGWYHVVCECGWRKVQEDRHWALIDLVEHQRKAHDRFRSSATTDIECRQPVGTDSATR